MKESFSKNKELAPRVPTRRHVMGAFFKILQSYGTEETCLFCGCHFCLERSLPPPAPNTVYG